jgi:hypothetical protein
VGSVLFSGCVYIRGIELSEETASTSSVLDPLILKELTFRTFRLSNNNLTNNATQAMDVTDISPIAECYQSLDTVLQGYQYGFSPIINSSSQFQTNSNMSRAEFIQIIYRVLTLARVEGQLSDGSPKTVYLNECKPNLGLSITGATINDIDGTSPSFAAVQCLVDLGYGSNTYGFLNASGNIELSRDLTHREMYTLINKMLQIFESRFSTVVAKNSNFNEEKYAQLIKKLRAYYQLSFLMLLNSSDSFAQVTSITQFSDILPADPAYADIANLIERYGMVQGYPDGTLRLDQAPTRCFMIMFFSGALDVINSIYQNYESNLRSSCETVFKGDKDSFLPALNSSSLNSSISQKISEVNAACSGFETIVDPIIQENRLALYQEMSTSQAMVRGRIDGAEARVGGYCGDSIITNRKNSGTELVNSLKSLDLVFQQNPIQDAVDPSLNKSQACISALQSSSSLSGTILDSMDPLFNKMDGL